MTGRCAPIAAALWMAACATETPSVPRCAPAAEWVPPVALGCRIDDDVTALETRLSVLLEPDAGPLRVHVAFDERAAVGSVCTERDVGPDDWQARARIAERLEVLRSLPPGPACLAGRRLVFNRFGAHRAEVEELLAECDRRPARQRDDCVYRHQVERNELWVFAPMRAVPEIYVETEDSSPRRAAILECASRGAAAGRAAHDPAFGVATTRRGAASCMRAHGWHLLY